MARVLVNLLVPVDHGLEARLNSLHYTVDQKLVVVGQQSSGLLRLHAQRSAEGVEDELQGRLGGRRLLIHVHLEDVNSVLHDFLLVRLLSPLGQHTFQSLSLLTVDFAVIFKVFEVENRGVTGEASHVTLDPLEEFADLEGVTGHVRSFGVVFNDDSDFLKKRLLEEKVTYVKFSAEVVPVEKAALRTLAVLQITEQVAVHREVLVLLLEHLLQHDQVVGKDHSVVVALAAGVIQDCDAAVVKSLDVGVGLEHIRLQQTVKQFNVDLGQAVASL